MIPITLCHMLCYLLFILVIIFVLIIYIECDRHHSRNVTNITFNSLRYFNPKREIRILAQLNLE